MRNVAGRLHDIIAAVCPITGVSIGNEGESKTVKVFPPELQKDAQPTIDAFDWSDDAQAAWERKKRQAAAKAILFDADADAQTLALWAMVKHLQEQVYELQKIADIKPVDGADLIATLQASVDTGIVVPVSK